MLTKPERVVFASPNLEKRWLPDRQSIERGRRGAGLDLKLTVRFNPVDRMRRRAQSLYRPSAVQTSMVLNFR
jgi:hypothetical protein